MNKKLKPDAFTRQALFYSIMKRFPVQIKIHVANLPDILTNIKTPKEMKFIILNFDGIDVRRILQVEEEPTIEELEKSIVGLINDCVRYINNGGYSYNFLREQLMLKYMSSHRQVFPIILVVEVSKYIHELKKKHFKDFKTTTYQVCMHDWLPPKIGPLSFEQFEMSNNRDFF